MFRFYRSARGAPCKTICETLQASEKKKEKIYMANRFAEYDFEL